MWPRFFELDPKEVNVFDQIGKFFENLQMTITLFLNKLFAFKVEGWDLVQMILLLVSAVVALVAPQYAGVGFITIALCMWFSCEFETQTSRWEWRIYIASAAIPAWMLAFGNELWVTAMVLGLSLGVVYQLFIAQFTEPETQAVQQTQRPAPQPQPKQTPTPQYSAPNPPRSDRPERQERQREVTMETDQGSIRVRDRRSEDQE